jgi:hypothetical protein
MQDVLGGHKPPEEPEKSSLTAQAPVLRHAEFLDPSYVPCLGKTLSLGLSFPMCTMVSLALLGLTCLAPYQVAFKGPPPASGVTSETGFGFSIQILPYFIAPLKDTFLSKPPAPSSP